MSALVLVHLYARELDIDGDSGNVLALERRAAWRGLPMDVLRIGAGDALPAEAHLVHVGSGSSAARSRLHDDVLARAERLHEWAAAGVPFLAVAAGWQLLGTSVTELDGTVRPGAGVLPSSAVLTADRAVGEVAGQSDLGDVAGFENHAAVIRLAPGVRPLAHLRRGHGNAGAAGPVGDAPEGLASGALVATGLHGPFLPMNPAWADRLLEHAARRAGIELPGADARVEAVDALARRSREAVRRRLGLTVA